MPVTPQPLAASNSRSGRQVVVDGEAGIDIPKRHFSIYRGSEEVMWAVKACRLALLGLPEQQPLELVRAKRRREGGVSIAAERGWEERETRHTPGWLWLYGA